MAYADDVIVGPSGAEISSTDFGNPVKAHLNDLDARDLARLSETNALRADLGTWSGGTAISRLGTLETRTTDTATAGGHGNVRLSDRLGTGVGTGTNVTTGNATSQLGDLRTRAGSLETDKIAKAHWYQATQQTITRNAIVKVNLDSTDFNSSASIAANRTDITLSRTGMWLLYYGFRFAGNRSDWLRTVIWFGLTADSSTRYGFAMFGPGSNGVQDPGTSFAVPVNVTESLSLSAYVYHNNSGSADVPTFVQYTSTEVWAKYLG